jgi:COMPASS component SWD1
MLSHVRDFNNAVERCGWSDACMTGDSEYVVGAAAIKATHHVYLWDRHAGRMERILEGEGLDRHA